MTGANFAMSGGKLNSTIPHNISENNKFPKNKESRK